MTSGDSITLEEFTAAIRQFPRESLQAELDHLINAHQHLLSSYTDLLDAYRQAENEDESREFAEFIRENFDAMQRQRDKMLILVERLLEESAPIEQSSVPSKSSVNLTQKMEMTVEQAVRACIKESFDADDFGPLGILLVLLTDHEGVPLFSMPPKRSAKSSPSRTNLNLSSVDLQQLTLNFTQSIDQSMKMGLKSPELVTQIFSTQPTQVDPSNNEDSAGGGTVATDVPTEFLLLQCYPSTSVGKQQCVLTILADGQTVASLGWLQERIKSALLPSLQPLLEQLFLKSSE